MTPVTANLDVLERDLPAAPALLQPPAPVDIHVGLLAPQAATQPRQPAKVQLRHEFKFVVPDRDTSMLRMVLRLHRAGFRAAHPPRRVNNVYFDTPDLACYAQNLAGGAERTKLRFRWYGDAVRNVRGTLEIKCKRDVAGWKEHVAIAEPIDLASMSWRQVLATMSRRLDDHWRVRMHKCHSPVIINRYRREYLVSADGRIRATLDEKITCCDQRLSPRPNLNRPVPRSGIVVLELKASVEHRDPLADAASRLPWRIARHSKYQSGVEAALGGY